MDLSSFASKPQPGKGKSVGIPAGVIAFLQECKKQCVRIPYGALSFLCKPELPKGSKMMRGQHGSGRAKALELALQPLICRADGGYDPKGLTAFGEIEGIEAADPVTDGDGNTTVALTVAEGEYHPKDGKPFTEWNVISSKQAQGAFAAFEEERAKGEADAGEADAS